MTAAPSRPCHSHDRDVRPAVGQRPGVSGVSPDARHVCADLLTVARWGGRGTGAHHATLSRLGRPGYTGPRGGQRCPARLEPPAALPWVRRTVAIRTGRRGTRALAPMRALAAAHGRPSRPYARPRRRQPVLAGRGIAARAVLTRGNIEASNGLCGGSAGSNVEGHRSPAGGSSLPDADSAVRTEGRIVSGGTVG